jgi:Family of unknown function (DUF5684)
VTTTIAAVLLQSDMSNPFAALFGGAMLLVWLAILLVTIIGGWKTFEKAGQPGWAIFIPIYNVYILLKIAGRPGWWLLLLLIPLVNLAIAFIVAIDVAKSFGEGAVFGILLLAIFSPIGYLMLGFGNYRYLGPAAATR